MKPFIINTDNHVDVIQTIIQQRKKSTTNIRTEWFAVAGTLRGKQFQVKVFDKFVQVCDIDGIRYGQSTPFKTVKAFKEFITSTFSGVK